MLKQVDLSIFDQQECKDKVDLLLVQRHKHEENVEERCQEVETNTVLVYEEQVN